jgi:hypothetical protein
LDFIGVVVRGTLGKSWCIARCQPNTCCEQTCHRRATSDTRAPGTSVSATIRTFSPADQRRRRPGPVRISTRRYPPFASSLTSNIWIARSPLPQANQPLPGRRLKKGVRAPLTKHQPKATVERLPEDDRCYPTPLQSVTSWRTPMPRGRQPAGDHALSEADPGTGWLTYMHCRVNPMPRPHKFLRRCDDWPPPQWAVSRRPNCMHLSRGVLWSASVGNSLESDRVKRVWNECT